MGTVGYPLRTLAQGLREPQLEHARIGTTRATPTLGTLRSVRSDDVTDSHLLAWRGVAKRTEVKLVQNSRTESAARRLEQLL